MLQFLCLRAKENQFAEKHPVANIAGNVMGGILSPVTRAVTPYMTGGKAMMQRMGKSAAGGGGLGFIFGANNAAPGERLEGGTEGLALGTLLGGASVPLIEGIGRIGRVGLQKILDRRGGLTAAEQKIANTIAEVLGGGDLRVGIQKVREALTKGGDDVAIADVTGIKGQRLARAAANVPDSQATQTADDFVNARAGGRGARMQDAADELAPNNFHSRLEALDAEKKALSSPLYDDAFAPVSNPDGRVFAQWDDRLQSFLDEPIVQQGLSKGIKIQKLEALAEGRPFNFKEYAVKGFDDSGNVIIEGTPNLRAMDAAKRGMDDMLEAYRDKTTGKLVLDDMGRAINNVRRALVKKLDDITTDPATGVSKYAEARAAWAGPSKLQDAVWKGRRFLRGDEEMTRKVFEGMTDAEQEAFQLGVRRELSKTITRDTQAAPGRFAAKKEDLWTRLESIFPPDKFASFRKAIGNEQRKMQTDSFVSPRAGSHTTPMKEDIADLARVPASALDALVKVGSGNKLGAVGSMARGLTDRLTRPHPETANGLAKMLLELDPTKQSAMLRQLGQRKMAEEVAPILNGESRRSLAALLARGTTAGTMGR